MYTMSKIFNCCFCCIAVYITDYVYVYVYVCVCVKFVCICMHVRKRTYVCVYVGRYVCMYVSDAI